MASRATRDLGLQRIGTSTRFLAVGALVAGGVLSAAVAKALPGKSTHPDAHTSNVNPAPQSPVVGSSSGGDGSQSTIGPSLTAPTQAPQPVTASPMVSSGGS